MKDRTANIIANIIIGIVIGAIIMIPVIYGIAKFAAIIKWLMT